MNKELVTSHNEGVKINNKPQIGDIIENNQKMKKNTIVIYIGGGECVLIAVNQISKS